MIISKERCHDLRVSVRFRVISNKHWYLFVYHRMEKEMFSHTFISSNTVCSADFVK